MGLHPDKNPNNLQEAEVKLNELSNAYELVKEEHHLKAYYQAYQQGRLADSVKAFEKMCDVATSSLLIDS